MKSLNLRALPLLLLALTLLALAPAPVHAVTDEEIATLAPAESAGADVAVAKPVAPLFGNKNPEAPGLVGLATRMVIALGVVFGLMAAVLWAARKYLPQAVPSARGGLIEIAASRALGQRRSLVLVRTQGRTLLLGVTPQAINLLGDFDAEPVAWNEAAQRAGLPAAGFDAAHAEPEQAR